MGEMFLMPAAEEDPEDDQVWAEEKALEAWIIEQLDQVVVDE